MKSKRPLHPYLRAFVVMVMLGFAQLGLAQQQAATLIVRSTPAAPPSPALAEPETGPVIEGLGPVYPVPGDALNLDASRHYKVLMDVSRTGDFAMALNTSLESAARFLNMHARNGIAPEQIELSVVVHGAATKDVLGDTAYRDRFGVNNPNTRLLDALGEAGVMVYVCGQSAAHAGYRPTEMHPAVRTAVSAMTAHVRLQSEGYVLIPF